MFRSEGLAKALTDAGHSISPRTVDRWKAGESRPSKGHLQAIRELVGTPDTAKEPPDPSWIERLLAGVMALETESEITELALAEAEARAAAYLAVARQRRQRPGAGGGGVGSSP